MKKENLNFHIPMTAGAKLAIKNDLLLQIVEFEHLATFLRHWLLTWKAFSTINISMMKLKFSSKGKKEKLKLSKIIFQTIRHHHLVFLYTQCYFLFFQICNKMLWKHHAISLEFSRKAAFWPRLFGSWESWWNSSFDWRFLFTSHPWHPLLLW